MNLVTVACNRDFNQMLLQAESIQMHLDPCTHWVIVNERNPDINFWQSALSPFYKNHELKLLFPGELLFPGKHYYKGGWNSQQTYKFWIFRLIKDDYLILDSKNFFIRKTSVKEWQENFLDNEVSFSNNFMYKDIANIYAKYLEMPLPERHLRIHTPFFFKKSVLETFENYNEFILWFDKTTVQYRKSEFMFYSFLLEKTKMYPEIMKQTESWTYAIFPDNPKSLINRLEEVSKYNTIKAVSIHRSVLNSCTDYELEYLNIWLSSRNFQTEIKRLTTN